MITKQQLINGCKQTKKVVVGDHEFTIRALSNKEISEIVSAQMKDVQMELPQKGVRAAPTKIEMGSFLSNTSKSEYIMLSMAIVEEKWTIEELEGLSYGIIAKLIKNVNELSGITDDLTQLQSFR